VSIANDARVKFDHVIGLGRVHLKGTDLSSWVSSEVRRLDVSAFISEDMIEGVKHNLSRATGKPLSSTFLENGRLSAKGVQQATRVANSITALHFLYYKGLLKSMDGLLAAPALPIRTRGDAKARKKGDKRGSFFMNRIVPLHLTGYNNDGVRMAAANRNAYLEGRWTTLSAKTVAIKKLLGKDSQVFWRHNGELSKVYHRHMLDQLARLSPKSFVGKVTTQLNAVEANNDIRYRSRETKGRYYRKASIRMEVGVPTWNTVMDEIVTVPLATGKQPRIGNLFRVAPVRLQALQARKAKAGGRRPGDANFYDLRVTERTSGEKGIRKVLSPEFRRPWLRQLSTEAYRNLYQALRKLSIR
jgi:hypothetical protein